MLVVFLKHEDTEKRTELELDSAEVTALLNSNQIQVDVLREAEYDQQKIKSSIFNIVDDGTRLIVTYEIIKYNN